VEPSFAGHDALSFALRGKIGPVVLDPRGVHHPLTARGGRTFTRYEDIVHLALSQRAFWIGSRSTVAVLPRRAFVDPQAPDVLARALVDRIASLHGAQARLARMQEIDARAERAGPSYATWGLSLLCVAVYVLQLVNGWDVYSVGYMSPALVAAGEAWRIVTANLLHGFPLHLILNLVALATFGTLCERPLGTARTLAVMGVSGLAAMTASAAAGYDQVVGVSGVASGLIGAVTWLEHFRSEELPAWWRVPRSPLYVMIGLTALLGFVPGIAGAAHVGGFLGGALAAWLLVDGPLRGGPAPAPVRALAASVVLATAAGVGAAGAELRAPGEYCVRQISRLEHVRGISAMELNNCAWNIAIADAATTEELESARALAERAVEDTRRKEPTILDTLAELQFRLGDAPAAIATIEEAMALDPNESYYSEQRRRFLGERQDRPPDPNTFPRWFRRDEPEDPGITV
jgi:membrane associated rhomboid family serine protease